MTPLIEKISLKLRNLETWRGLHFFEKNVQFF